MRAVLAWSYSRILTFRSPSSASTRLLHLELLEHKSAGLTALKALVTCASVGQDSLLLFEFMLYLGEIEWFAHCDAVLAHFRAARIWLDRIGDFKRLSQQTQQTLVRDFVNISFTHQIRPLLEADEFDSGPWVEQEAVRASSNHLLGGRLRHPIQSTRPRRNVLGQADPELTELFTDVKEINMGFDTLVSAFGQGTTSNEPVV